MLQSDWVERPPARGMTIPVATIPTIIVSSWILSEANQRFDTGIAMGLAFEYHRFVIGAETQVGFVTVNKQLNLMMNPDGYSEYLPRNFAAFFTVGYRF